VYSLDWLGVGLSTRPVWPPNGNDPAVAEAFFADSLEQWRQEMGIERMHLVAHSLSAFFAVRYAEQHPGRLESLVSPW
jgi:cardiolipin-specific phospholipase